MSATRTEPTSSPDPAPKLPLDLIFQIVGMIAAIATIVYVTAELL